MSARSRALIPLSAEQQAAMQAVAVTEQRRQGRTLSAWPYATAFFRCLNGSRR
ncbi:plasmid SOS inhibition protein A, partial [Escherichia coli]